MTADFEWWEFNGAADTGEAANCNFGNSNGRDLTPADNPITAGSASYEKYVYGSFSGTFTKIYHLKFWESSGGNIGAGEAVEWACVTATAAPVNTISVVAVASVAESEPGYYNVSFSGATTTGSITSADTTDYIVLQHQIVADHAAGATSQLTFTLQYDEL